MKPLFFLSACLLASPLKAIEPSTLIESCEELVAIYDKQQQKNLLAGLSTSVSEAMRAGLCRGMLEEHSQHTRSPCKNTWYEQAMIIAAQDEQKDPESSEHLLDRACHG